MPAANLPGMIWLSAFLVGRFTTHGRPSASSAGEPADQADRGRHPGCARHEVLAGAQAAYPCRSPAQTLKGRFAMKIPATVLFVIFLGAPLIAGDDAAAKARKELQGDWQIISIVADGKPVELEDDAKLNIVTFSGDKIKFKLDPAKDPKHFDLTQFRDFQEIEVKGIYKLEGDTLKICVDTTLKDRPTAFESKKGSGWRLNIYKRVK
jgi:uncharacterized protein (TIGR03067 family)